MEEKKFIEFFSLTQSQQNYFMKELEKADWKAGKSLCHRIQTGNLISKTLEDPKLFLMVNQHNDLMAYCVLSKQDDIADLSLSPWIGYVYTYPKFRGQRLIFELLDYVEKQAAKYQAKQVYISTGHEGLYEKGGYSFFKEALDIHGGLSRIYVKSLD